MVHHLKPTFIYLFICFMPQLTHKISINGGGSRSVYFFSLGSSSSLIYLRFDIRSNKLPVP